MQLLYFVLTTALCNFLFITKWRQSYSILHSGSLLNLLHFPSTQCSVITEYVAMCLRDLWLKPLLKCTKLLVCDNQCLCGKKPHILIDTFDIFKVHSQALKPGMARECVQYHFFSTSNIKILIHIIMPVH